MRDKWIRIFCLLALALNTILLKGNQEITQLMETGKYQEAIIALEELQSVQQVPSKEILSDLAYSYYQVSDIPKAILNYERVLKINPGNREVKEALKVLYDQLEFRQIEIPDFILSRMFRDLAGLLSSGTWAWIEILIFVLLLAILARHLFIQRIRKSYYVFGLFAFLLLSTAVLASKRYAFETDTSHAILMKKDSFLMNSADERSGIKVPLSPGTKLEIIDSIGSWLKVLLPDKDMGWVKKEELEII